MAAITLSPTSGVVGDRIAITGSGFGWGSRRRVTATLAGSVVAVGTTTTLGAVSLAFVIPSLATNTYTVTVKSQNTTAKASLGVTSGPPPPPPSPPPGTTIPPIPGGEGLVFTKNFADGNLGPFQVLTFPDDHIGQFGQDWTIYNRFSNGARQVTVHDGYADLRATLRTDGLWNAVLLGTSISGNGSTFGYGKFSACSRANLGRANWPGQLWFSDTTTWGVTELDWEVLEGQQASAHVHGAGSGSWYGAPPADWATAWHVFYVERRATYVAFGWDGVEKWRSTASMPSTALAIMLDVKAGFPWAEGPDASSPNPMWLQVAWVIADA